MLMWVSGTCIACKLVRQNAILHLIHVLLPDREVAPFPYPGPERVELCFAPAEMFQGIKAVECRDTIICIAVNQRFPAGKFNMTSSNLAKSSSVGSSQITGM